MSGIPFFATRRLRYGIGHVSRDQIAEAARRVKVERVIRDLRELGHAGIAQILELSERSARNHDGAETGTR